MRQYREFFCGYVVGIFVYFVVAFGICSVEWVMWLYILLDECIYVVRILCGACIYVVGISFGGLSGWSVESEIPNSKIQKFLERVVSSSNEETDVCFTIFYIH